MKRSTCYTGALRGSASIAQLSDSVIALERNQQDGSQHSDTTVRVLKNRYSGETGIACRLEYNLEECKFTENETQPFSNSTPQQTFKHPWYTYNELRAPNPPTKEAVEKAKFVDKTYVWKGK